MYKPSSIIRVGKSMSRPASMQQPTGRRCTRYKHEVSPLMKTSLFRSIRVSNYISASNRTSPIPHLSTPIRTYAQITQTPTAKKTYRIPENEKVSSLVDDLTPEEKQTLQPIAKLVLQQQWNDIITTCQQLLEQYKIPIF